MVLHGVDFIAAWSLLILCEAVVSKDALLHTLATIRSACTIPTFYITLVAMLKIGRRQTRALTLHASKVIAVRCLSPMHCLLCAALSCRTPVS